MTQGERVKRVRDKAQLTMEQFGERLGNVSKSTISNIENDNRNLTDHMLKSICREFDVNVDWLRTGAGEMFKKRLPEDEVASYVEDLLESDENPVYEVIIGMMKAYHEMDETSRQAALEFFRRLKENLEK